jgi:hypothetical protein
MWAEKAGPVKHLACRSPCNRRHRRYGPRDGCMNGFAMNQASDQKNAVEPAKRLALVKASIEAAAREAGRAANAVELIAVSKTFPAESIEPVIQAGQRVFGENRVQEAQSKWPGLKEKYGWAR